MRTRWVGSFALAWFGIWMAQLTPVQLLLPAQVEARLNTSDWLANVQGFGMISGLAAVCALIAYPLTGALSDRTTGRWGRRRPWILAGSLVFALSLLGLGCQESLWGIGVFWCLAMIGFCLLTAALTATISDQVPVGQRGLVSGWMSAPQALGIIIGLVLVTVLETGALLGYALLGALLVLCALPFLLLIPDAPLPRGSLPKLNLRTLIEGFWISPRQFPDFGWTLLSRVLTNLGNALGTSLLLYFLQFGLHRQHAEDDLILLTAVYMVLVIVASLLLGGLSDRLGRRKIFVIISSLLQSLAAVLLILNPDFSSALFAAALLGAGYGCFLSVDQALATQVLPDPASRGKDLGIMNIALTVPQAAAPLLGAWVISAVGGFTGLFILSSLFALAGALTVLKVKEVR
ncbi:MFS transporter [Psychromicrobium sp. YIM B11713]|uniref:MFS transporter n=1 Tax=Psychromicrobium sp. YIM B11713 TaxID=3145233 RepID=UPI00374E7529